jgi:hypothetical protein
VVAHLEQALLETSAALREAGIDLTTRERWKPADTDKLLARGGGAVIAVLARNLPEVPESEPRAAAAADAPPVAILAADLHVLASENQRVVRFADSLAAPTVVTSSVSFDQPIMNMFAKPWVKQMMSSMGLKPGEVIASPFVTRGLVKALRKIEAKATGNVPCKSIDEWLRRNTQP